MSVHVITNIPYLGSARQEALDLYCPVYPPSHPLPGVVIIHGGSWAKGDKASPRIVALAETLAHHGFICASVNFLLATPAVPSWPTCLLDCKTAVQFLRVHAREYGIDPLTYQHPPVLLIHGSDDTNVPLNQTYAYAAHLQAYEIAHTVVVIPDAGHLPEQALLMPHILAFLTAYLKPVPEQENSQRCGG